MVDQVLGVFGIVPNVDLNLMEMNQTLSKLTSRLISGLGDYLRATRPHLVLVQGDTTTTLCGALASFYERIPVGHVEAGLRTGNRGAPFPEEINRQLVTRLADLHFAPTAASRANLLEERVNPAQVFVVGNTVVDALLLARTEVSKRTARGESPLRTLDPGLRAALSAPERRLVLITGHRRESFGQGFENICLAIAQLAGLFPSIEFVFPVHMNPHVGEPARRILGRQPNVYLLEPLPYLTFVALMDRATLVLTDSGGIQEEAPSLGKTVLVLRDTTERPEAVTGGTALLIGTVSGDIVASVSRVLDNPGAVLETTRHANPFGDGQSSRRIMEVCDAFLQNC